MSKKAIVYIDGYNWYHAIFKHRPEWKWVNIQSYFESLLPHDDILFVKMFSSWIRHDPDAQDRQKRYFDALGTLPKVRLVLGVFQPREVTCRGECKNKYLIQEEKKTDVNLAVEIINDAVKELCEHIIVVSGDSDIQPAVEWVAKNKPDMKLTVLVPLLPDEYDDRRVDYYKTKNLAVDCAFLNLKGIKENQFPNFVMLGGGKKAIRPHVWKSAGPPLAGF
jgi:uncharacterized LabA/DUF88 family protein